jgi:hypothetical protein
MAGFTIIHIFSTLLVLIGIGRLDSPSSFRGTDTFAHLCELWDGGKKTGKRKRPRVFRGLRV